VPAKMFLSKDGEWFHEDVKITHPNIIERLHSNFKREGDDYFVNIGYERCKVIIEDAPYIVGGVRFENNHIVLELTNGTEQIFDPDTLSVGKDNVPYTIVNPTRDKARFTRPAYYQLAQNLVEGPDGKPAIKIGENTHILNVDK